MSSKNKQSIAIALEVSKRSKKKKYAKGGQIPESPIEKTANDSSMVHRNEGKKHSPDSFTNKEIPTESSNKPKIQKIKHPKMVPSTGFSAKLRDQEDDQLETMRPNNGPQRQPPEMYNELDADKEGPDHPQLHMKRMAEGGSVNKPPKMPDEDKAKDFIKGFQSGGPSIEEMYEGAKSAVKSVLPKRMAEGGTVKKDLDCVTRPDAGFGKVVVCSAEGGEIPPGLSLVDEILLKRRKMAEGGAVGPGSDMADIEHENNVEHPNYYYDRNEDFALKENYDEDMLDVSQPMDSNEKSVELDSDDHDMVSAIRKKMAAKRGMR